MLDAQLRVLIVANSEDEYIATDKLLSEIRSWRFSVAWEPSYQAALAAMLKNQHQLYLLHESSGQRQAAQLIKEAIDRNCQAAFIVLTDQPDLELDPKFMEAGSADYLLKNQLNAPLLQLAIRATVARAQATAQLRASWARYRQLEEYAVQWDALLSAEQEQRKLAEALHDITLALNATLRFDELLDRILTNVGRVVPHDTADIMLIDADLLQIVGSRGYLEFGQPSVLGMEFRWDELPNLGHIAATGRPVAIPYTRANPHWVDIPETSWVESYVGAPIYNKDELVGFLNLASAAPHFFNDGHAQRLLSFANQVGLAIGNARLLEAERKQRDLAETMREATTALVSALELPEVLENILTYLEQLLSYHSACVFLLEQDKLRVVAGRGLVAPQQVIGQSFPMEDDQIFSELQRTQRPIYIADVRNDPRFLNWGGIDDVRGWMVVPLISRAHVIGCLTLDSRQVGAYGETEAALAQTFANQAAIAIQNASLYETIRQQKAAEHRRLESLVAHLPNGVILLDSEQRLTLANQAARQLMPHLTQDVVTGDKLIQLGQHTLAAILASEPGDSPFTLEVEGLLSQIFEVTANPITAGSEAGGWILVIRDVTEERLAQKRIQQQDRLAAVGQLAAGIAHDFNNILTSVIGFAELLRLNPSLSATAKGDVERIIRQGQRGAHLVRQILDFGRQTISDRRATDLTKFTQEVIRLLERTIPENINITLETEPGSFTIMVDSTQLQQALTNLAINARDAMPSGGQLDFRLSRFSLCDNEATPCQGMPPGDWAALAISDTGVGIPPDIKDKIFEPFFTTKEVGQGTGLGLAQVYGIMEQHEGHISVASQVGVGTTFTLYFPLVSTQPVSPSLSESNLPKGHQELILLVEDNADVLQTTTSMLKHLGYRVLTARNGQEALRLYGQYQLEIALVLTDMTMPEMGGAELTQALHRRNPGLKVVVLTGYPLGPKTKNPLPEGITNWLQKPPRLEHLAQVVNKSLG